MFRRWGGWGWWRVSRACWEYMTNPAGWWAQSPKQYSSTSRVFRRSRWSSTNWLNLDRMTQPTTSVNNRRGTAQSNCGFRHSFSRKQMMMLRHLERQHLKTLWRVLTLFPKFRKGRKGLLAQDIVISDWIRRSRNQYRAYLMVNQQPSPIRQRGSQRSQLNK